MALETSNNPIVEVSPFRCRMWHMHDRLAEYVDDRSCARELESVRQYGQKVPALGRPVEGDRDVDVELIYGARRLYVARQLGKKLLVEIRPMSDREAVIAMDIENRQRRDISPYERGLNLKALLRAGYFESQSELAHVLGISQAGVCRLLRFAEIPPVIVGAFASPLDIREAWGVTIATWLDDPSRRERLVATARALARNRNGRSPEQVFRLLLDVASGKRHTMHAAKRETRDEIVRGESGNMLFRVSRRHKDVHIILPLDVVSADSTLKMLTNELRRVLTTILVS